MVPRLAGWLRETCAEKGDVTLGDGDCVLLHASIQMLGVQNLGVSQLPGSRMPQVVLRSDWRGWSGAYLLASEVGWCFVSVAAYEKPEEKGTLECTPLTHKITSLGPTIVLFHVHP